MVRSPSSGYLFTSPLGEAVARDASCRDLDLVSFPNFSPLLSVSRSYVNLSGFRFRASSFEGIDVHGGDLGMPVVSAERAQDSGLLLAAKLQAWPIMLAFAARLRAEEPMLIKEIEEAFRLVAAESDRNGMIGVCKAVGCFPPPSKTCVSAEDCDFEMERLTAPLPVVAQRLHNDQLRRCREAEAAAIASHGNETGIDRTTTTSVAAALSLEQRRAATASYLVDFACEMGMRTPTLAPGEAEKRVRQNQEFADRAWKWLEKREAREAKKRCREQVRRKGSKSSALLENSGLISSALLENSGLIALGRSLLAGRH